MIKYNTKQKCDVMLQALLGNKEVIVKWWNTPNKAFNDETPIEVFERDEQLVFKYLASQCSGSYY